MPPMMPPLPVSDLDHTLSHTRDLWDEARGCRVFITGGTGFFGSWLVESFCHANDRLSLGAEVTILTRSAKAFTAKSPHIARRGDIKLLEGDLRSFDFPEGEFPFVVHAGATARQHLPPMEMFDALVDGTRRVLEFARRSGTRKLLLTSSGAVYGRIIGHPGGVPEDWQGFLDFADPNAAYATGKRAAEWLCATAGRESGLEVKVARCFAFVGAHLPLDGHFAIGNFISDGLAGRDVEVKGDGTAVRSYLYAADLAIWLWTILFRGKDRRAWNVGGAEPISVAELAHRIGARFGLRSRIAREPELGAEPVRYLPDVTRARLELGLEAWVRLDDAIARTVDYLRNLART